MYNKVIKVLLVEDDEDDYVITRELLAEIKGEKFDLMWIATYQEALEAIIRNDYDVCLIDYRLGERNGVELLRASHARGCKMPAILLTGQDSHQLDIKAMKAGASDYLVKDHLNTDSLERAIRYAIERSMTLEALRKSEQRYRSIIENTSEGIWTLDTEGQTNYVNQRMAETLGYTVDEILVRSYFDFMDEDARDRASGQLERLRQGIAYEYEIELRHRDGRKLWMRVSGNPLFDDNDEVAGSLALMTDITERKQSENALRQSNDKFQQLANNLTDAFWIRSPDMRELHYVSPAYEQIYGRPAESLHANPQLWTDFILPDDRELALAAFDSLTKAAPSISIEYRIVRPDDKVRWIHVRGFQVRDDSGELISLTGIVTDITERKWAETSLVASEQRLELATNSAQIGIWDWDVPANKIAWDKRMYSLYGIREPDFGGAYDAWQKVLHPEDRARAEDEIAAALEGSRDFHTEFRVVWPNGEVRHIEAHALVQRARDGSPMRMIGINWDSTERRHVEEVLHEADRRAIREYDQLLERIALLAQALGTGCELSIIYRALQDFSMASVPCNGMFISLYDQKRNE